VTIGIDISPDKLALAGVRCPGASLLQGDVSAEPDLFSGPADVITAFRFFLNAEPELRSSVLTWMHRVLSDDGLLVTNFHLNPNSLRARYLRLRLRSRTRMPMLSVKDAHDLLNSAGFSVRWIKGYSYLPFRRQGNPLLAPRLRRVVEERLLGVPWLLPLGGSLLVVAGKSRQETGATRTPGGQPP
jgi:hypothetical protein